MDKLRTTYYDASKYLETPEDIAKFMQEAVDSKDHATIVNAFGVVAKAIGIQEIVKTTGVKREELYRAFGIGGHPSSEIMSNVMPTLGVKLEE